MIQLDNFHQQLKMLSPYESIGKILGSKGTTYVVKLRKATIGALVILVNESGKESLGEVVSLKGDICHVMPYEDVSDVNTNTRVYLRGKASFIKLSHSLLGRVVDYSANAMDDKGAISTQEVRTIYSEPINPLMRSPISEPLDVGVNAINGFCTIGKGQRISILAGSGVGKSVLMGMMSKKTSADVNVIALIGERGREVLDFIENELGEEGMQKSVVVVATSDMSPLMKIRAAYTATTIAEFFRDQGKDVLLMMDSITRFAMAYREIGMSIGEPVGQKGYGPTVFAKLPKLMERAGTIKSGGSITGVYTVLVEGGDMDEPIADAVRSIADGHLVLSRELAAKNHYPAIDVLGSLSRVMNRVVSRDHQVIASHLRDLMGQFKEAEDLINIGAYVAGSNVKVDKAIAIMQDLNDLLKQQGDNSLSLDEVLNHLIEIARKGENAVEVDG